MWHETSAPRSLADVAWSHQKVTELSTWLQAYQTGGMLRALVMSGPSGCGKLSTLQAMFPPAAANPNSRDACATPSHAPLPAAKKSRSHAAASAAAALQHQQWPLTNVAVHVLHGVEASAEELSGFLGGAALRAQRPRAANAFDIFVVKGLPGDGAAGSAGDSNHNRSGGFVSSVRQRSAAVLAQHLRQLHDSNTRRSGQVLCHALTVFLCTIHDVHSEKVALSDYFGASFLGSPLVHKLRCTAVTERSMAMRLQAVAAQHGVPWIDGQLVALLAASAHGDMRQALLQLQWALLLAPGTRHPSPHSAHARQPSSASGSAPCVAVDEADGGGQLFGLLRSGGAAGARGKRPRSGPVAGRQSTRKAAASTVVDLIEDVDEAEGTVQQPSAAAGSSCGSGTQGAAESLDGPASVFCRDECINIAHGAARLLSQKYTLEQLRAVLSVPPWKIFAFFTHNLPLYFHAHQIDAFAQVAAAASRTEPSLLQLTERAFQAARSTDEDHLSISVAEMGVAVLCRAYRALHTQVQRQTTFAPHCPPPFQLFFFPRFVSHAGYLTASSRSHEQDASDGGGMDERRHVAAVFQASRGGLSGEYGLVRAHVMAPDRRTCPLHELILDYLPMAKRIVLETPMERSSKTSVCAAAAVPFGSAFPKVAQGSASSGPSGPKRTMFMCALPKPVPLRPVSETVFAALTAFDVRCRHATLRSEAFVIQSAPAAAGGLWGPGQDEDCIENIPD